MKSCIVKPHHAGLFSLINNVITCLDLYEHVHVDWSEGCLYGDVWGALFEPTMPPEGEHDIWAGYPDQWLTYKNAGHLYLSGNEWRQRCNSLWKRLRVSLQIELGARKIATEINAIGVMVRAHSHAGEQLSDKSQPLEDYARAIEKELAPGQVVYVMAGDEETLVWFGSRFPTVHNVMVDRSADRSTDRHLSAPQCKSDAMMCLLEVLTVSQLSTLIHPVSNMATAALYINPSLKSVFLQ